MRSKIPFRTLAILVAAAITIWLVFSEGTLTAILVAGIFFFLGSLLEVFQQREMLDRRRLIMYTVIYTLLLFLVIVVLTWRYRAILLG
jgi:predicted Na+-dependent transporter